MVDYIIPEGFVEEKKTEEVVKDFEIVKAFIKKNITKPTYIGDVIGMVLQAFPHTFLDWEIKKVCEEMDIEARANEAKAKPKPKGK